MLSRRGVVFSKVPTMYFLASLTAVYLVVPTASNTLPDTALAMEMS